ncbi:MAG: ABC transporter permease [Bdellovibrionales bacterium]
MWPLLWRRILAAAPTLLVVSILAFGLIRWVPGDPVTLMLGERGGSPEAVASLRANLGLDRPLLEQYFIFIKNAAQGDLGVSIISRRQVMDEFKELFPATIELSMAALFLAVLIGLPLGVAAAVWRNSWADRLATGAALLGYSMPIFWWGLILILIFSVTLKLTPVAGRMNVMYDFEAKTGFMLIDAFISGGWTVLWEALRHLFLPAVALATVPLAAISRMTRSSMLDVLREDYIRTARAKGLGDWAVIGRHALRNALVPIVTVIGLMGSTLLTGAILTETIFAWPGIGKWLVQSVSARDYPVIQGGLLMIGLIVIIVNFLVDVLYVFLNPLVRGHEN